jgi:uncharacterized damage-inducible protein DinB
MYTSAALLDMHERGQRTLGKLLDHCAVFTDAELHRELPGFGFPTLQLQLHHIIGAQDYWIQVALGRMFEDVPERYPTLEALQAYRTQVAEMTNDYLRGASDEELNTPRTMTVWGGAQHELMPARVFLRTLTHVYHHHGQVLAMCRILGRPGEPGMDFPIK